MRSPGGRVLWPVLLAVALGVLLVLVVPPGQPYDEPAHHANVVHYAEHHRMPVLGEPGVTYEGQMGPGYYVPAAILLTATGTTHDPHAGLLVLRFAGLLLIPVLGLVTYRLTVGLGASTRLAALAAALMVLNPSVLAISASVQNDLLCITVAGVAAFVCLRALRPDARARTSLAAGALIGLAVLVKVFAGGLLVGFVVASLVARGQPWRVRWTRAGAAVAAMAVVSGWWFLRNLRLYGDLTGAAGTEAAGTTFPPLPFDGVGSLLRWGRSLISYGFAPTEYYRNAFDAPFVIKGAAVLMTVTLVALVGWRLIAGRDTVRSAVPREPRVTFALLSVLVVVGVYAVAAWTVQSIAPRLMFVVAPLALGLLARTGADRGTALRLGLVLLGLFVLVDIWLLVQLAEVVDDPALFPWGGAAVTTAR